MELKYVGPKPIISHRGIDFDNNKEDKYVYLNIVVQLLKSINHEYIKNRVYRYHTDTHRLSDEQLYNELKKFCPNIAHLMEKENHSAEEEINHNIQRAHESEVLSDEDKEVLQNNINIMHDYLIQRSINKSVYYCAVNKLAELVRTEHLDYIIVPMFQKFAHALHSVQGSLQKQGIDIDTKLDIYQEDGKLMAKLKVINT